MMNNSVKRLFFMAILTTFFLNRCTAKTKKQQSQEKTFKVQDQFQEDFKDFFENIDSWFYGPSIKQKTTEETSLRSLIKDVQDWSAKLHKNATNSLYRLRNRSFSDLSQELKDIQAKLEASNKNLLTLIERTEKECEHTKKAGTYAVEQKTDDSSYTVIVDVPGINKDNIVVTVHAGNKTDKKENTLEISTKEPQTSDSTGMDSVKTHFERHMQSSVIESGKSKTKNYHFSYNNGAIRITQGLPDDIDPDKYTMTFNNEKIIIIFEKKPEAKNVKKLEFSSPKSAKGKACLEK